MVTLVKRPDRSMRSRAHSRTYTRWFGPFTTSMTWLAIVLAVAHPPHGIGRSICWTKSLTDHPCPGCGLTRSLSSGARGMVEESLNYHAFGLPLLALFAVIAVVSLLPRASRRRFANCVHRHPVLARAAYILFVTAFVTYGAARALLHAVQ